MRCWCGYLFGARCRLFAYGLADAIASQKTHHVLPHLNPDWFYLSGTGLSRLEKRPLNGCSSSIPVVVVTYWATFRAPRDRRRGAACRAGRRCVEGCCWVVVGPWCTAASARSAGRSTAAGDTGRPGCTTGPNQTCDRQTERQTPAHAMSRSVNSSRWHRESCSHHYTAHMPQFIACLF